METGVRRFPQYFPPSETARLRGQIEARPDLFQAVAAKAGMNLAYHVIDGRRIEAELPEIFALAAGRLREVAEEAAGVPLELMGDPKRALRVQKYTAREEGFLWHFDGGLWGALLTLTNSNGGGTEVMSPRLSRLLAPAPYLLFPFQGLISRAPSTLLVSAPGDLVILRGGTILHRGITAEDDGERLLLAVSYDPVGRPRRRLREAFARWLNY